MILRSKRIGVVKFYNPIKGFGFIHVNEENRDIFFHITSINGASPPEIGDHVSFFVGEKNGRPVACDVDVYLRVSEINLNEKVESYFDYFKNSSQNGGVVNSQERVGYFDSFPCVRDDSIAGFLVEKIIKKLETNGFDTVNEARDELVNMGKGCDADAIVNFIWHRETFFEENYFLIWNTGRSKVTKFWAEGTAIKVVKKRINY